MTGVWTDDGFRVALPAMRGDCGTALTFDRAYLNNGQRSITTTLHTPGRVGACRFARLHVEVKERERGRETLWCWISRGLEGSSGGFGDRMTDKARPLVELPVLAAVNREGFARVWTRLYACRAAESVQDAQDAAARARWAADWWTESAEVTAMLARGDVDIEPVPDDYERRVHVDVPEVRNGWCVTSHKMAAARLVWRGGQVGWLLEDGMAAPYRFRPVPRRG